MAAGWETDAAARSKKAVSFQVLLDRLAEHLEELAAEIE